MDSKKVSELKKIEMDLRKLNNDFGFFALEIVGLFLAVSLVVYFLSFSVIFKISVGVVLFLVLFYFLIFNRFKEKLGELNLLKKKLKDFKKSLK